MTNAGSDKHKKVPTEFTPSHQPKVKFSRMIKLSMENSAIEVNRSIVQASTEMNGIYQHQQQEYIATHSANGLGWNGLKSLDCILDIFGSVAMVSTCILDWAGLGL